MRHRERTVIGVVMAIVFATILAGSVAGCAGNRAPILLAQAGEATVASIGHLQEAGIKLVDAAVLPPAVALGFQEKLLALNARLKPLPDILRTIERLQLAEQSAASEVDKAIALLTVVGQDISVVVAGVPVGEATKVLIDLIRAAQQTVQTILIEIGKVKGASNE